MSKFIWVRDIKKDEHFINIDHIARVTRLGTPAKSGVYNTFIILKDDTVGGKVIELSNDTHDTYHDVVSKIQQVI